MGWTFWPYWGSHSVADPESCTDDLVATLHRRGIEPVTGDFSATTWTQHIVVGEATASADVGTASTEEEASGAAADETLAAPGDVVGVRFADSGTRRVIQVVGEGGPGSAGNSLDQILARALVGRAVDDEVSVEEGGKVRIVIVDTIRPSVQDVAIDEDMVTATD